MLMQQNKMLKEVVNTNYSINGALLTVIQNRLVTSQKDSELLLFGQIHTQRSIKTDDRQEQYTQISNCINFNESVILERDLLFREIDNQLMHLPQTADINAMIQSFSKQQFLGYCVLAQDRNLEPDIKDQQRCQFLLHLMKLPKIYFGVFSLSYINRLNQRPEQGQNYDTNHIIRFQYRMYEMSNPSQSKPMHELFISPIKLNILNLVNTQQIDNFSEMSQYQFVNNKVIQQMDSIANDIKSEIIGIQKKREHYFQEIRENEKTMAQMVSENERLRNQLEKITKEYFELQN